MQGLFWLSRSVYIFQLWLWICSSCRKQYLALSLFTTYHRVCSQSNTTGAISGARTASLLEFNLFLMGFKLLDLQFSVQCFVDCCLSFCPFSFGHFCVCPSSIYASLLPPLVSSSSFYGILSNYIRYQINSRPPLT